MIEKRPGIMIYRHPNLEIRSYLTSAEISRYRVERFTANGGEALETQLRTLGTIGAYVVREILAIPGVREVEIKPRELRVRKEASVSWDLIEPKIVHALNTAFRRKTLRVV
ncbi:MAG: NifU N-terminal domain-containing protein [Deltaproteobacteria bacterium]|nr:NifU N-terminal domain-containing protein [Deltaproteobacteria bacterium]